MQVSWLHFVIRSTALHVAVLVLFIALHADGTEAPAPATPNPNPAPTIVATSPNQGAASAPTSKLDAPQSASNSSGVPAETLEITKPEYLMDLANVHLKYGLVQRAAPLLRKVLDVSKDANQRESVFQALRMAVQRTGNWKDAIAVYKELADGASNASERGKLNLALADAYTKAKDLDNAEKLLLEVSKPNKERQDDQAQRQMAVNSLTQVWLADPKRVDAVISANEATLATNPEDVGALQVLIQIYTIVKHDLPKLNQYTEKLCALKPDDIDEQRKLVMLYLQGHQFDKAIEVDKKLMAMTTRRQDTRAMTYQIGNLLMQAGKKDEAIAWLKDNFVPGMTNSGDFMLLASFYEKVDMPTDAEFTLLQWAAAAKTPDEQAEAHMRVADLAFRRKDFTHTEEVLEGILKDYKDQPGIEVRVKSLMQRLMVEKTKAVQSIEPSKPPDPPPVKPVPEKPAEAPAAPEQHK